MGQTYSFWRFFSVVLALLALTTVTFGQTSQSARNLAPAPSKSKVATLVTMTECEGVNNCASWTFLGKQGTGQWPSGNIASLTVESYDNGSVVIRRADSTGASAGLTAVYTGTRHGTRVGGEFTSSWPGHWDNKSGNWYAIIGKAVDSPPSVMHFCAQHCFTLRMSNDGRYHVDGQPGNVWTVERWTRESVILHRRDSDGFGGVYAGQISEEGNTLINKTWNGQRDVSSQLTWGTALNSIPGSDGPAPVVVVARPVVCYPWFFGMICGP
jgi:hypothetical protein